MCDGDPMYYSSLLLCFPKCTCTFFKPYPSLGHLQSTAQF